MLESLKQTIANLATYNNQVIVSEQMTDTRANFVKGHDVLEGARYYVLEPE